MNNTLLKFYLFLLTLISFCSCADTTSKIENKDITNNRSRIENFVLAFDAMHPNWSQNSIINKKVDRLFKDSLTKLYHSKGIFDDFTFKFENVNEYSKGKYATKFENINDKLANNKNISVEIVGLVNDKIISQLVEGQTYQISGEFVKFLGNDLEKYFNYGFFNVSVGFDPLVDNTYFLGTALMKIDKVTPAYK